MLQKSTKINLLYRSSRQRCSIIKVFLKISQNSLEKTCVEVSSIRKDTQKHVLMWIWWNFKNICFLQNTSGRLLLFVIHLLSFILQISLMYIFAKLRLLEKSIKTQSCRFFYLQIHFILYIVSVLYRSEDSYSQVCQFKGLIYRIYLFEKLTLALNMERLRKQSLPGSIRCRSNKL